jgi:hypothetical protein
MQTLAKQLGLTPVPEAFAACFEAAKAEFSREGVYFLEESYIRALCARTNAFPRILEFTIAEAARIRGFLRAVSLTKHSQRIF